MRILDLLDEDENKELEDIALTKRYENNEAENFWEDTFDQEFCL